MAQPFVRIPPGQGRHAFEQRLADKGIDPLRKIDKLARAKPAFTASGTPGSVVSATIDLWRGLGTALLDDATAPALWPFDGQLDRLAIGRPMIVGEIYPRLAYALRA